MYTDSKTSASSNQIHERDIGVNEMLDQLIAWEAR